MRRRKPVRWASSIAALLVAVALAWLQQHNGSGEAISNTRSDNNDGSSAMHARNTDAFDYYVLSLSWSPQYCATDGRDEAEQCGPHRNYGLVVHGLWPQDERGYPENCATDRRVSDRIVDTMLDLMPSERLIRHEWATHGTCSGLDQDGYFQSVRRAYDQLQIPMSLQAGSIRIQTTTADLRKELLANNPQLSADGLAFQCQGSYLAEVRVCMDETLNPRACGSDVRSNCRSNPLIVRPIR